MRADAGMPYDVDNKTFEQLVERALAELPEQFAEFLEEVPIEVRPRPTRAQLKRLGLHEDQLLLGLYEGIPLTERSVEHSGVRPAVIYIFKEDVEDASDSEADLVEQVRITVLHEIGHHFGMDEDDLDELGYG
jgi:predicted Zn-dependent protease with MMP-like domain